MSHSYFTPAQSIETEYEVKKSRFIARAYCVKTREDALRYVEQAKNDYPDARHHCWAYQIGSPHSPTNAAMNDDGEPSGTAGKPILNVLQHKDVGDILIVVIRYFGGIKLGAGGLVRAYSSAAQMAMDALPLQENKLFEPVMLTGNYSFEQPLRHWLLNHGGSVENIQYEANEVIFSVLLESEYIDDLMQFMDAHGAQHISL